MSLTIAEMRRELTMQNHKCSNNVFGNDCAFCNRIFKLKDSSVRFEHKIMESRKRKGEKIC